jgi:16S rRNA (cytosine967-C5)-methyltransferase
MQVESRRGYPAVLLRPYAQDSEIHFPLLQSLVKGTLQRQAQVDANIQKYCAQNVESLAPWLRAALRVAAYQFFFLKDVPEKLVMRETLALHKKQGGHREEDEEGRRDFFPLRDCLESLYQAGQSGESAGEVFTLPNWIKQLLKPVLAKEYELFEAACSRPWPVNLRANSLKVGTGKLLQFLRKDGVKVSRGKIVEDCLNIERMPPKLRLTQLKSFERGLFQVQDESAMLPSILLDPQPGDRVLDMCAAPGAKATHLAQLMKNKGHIEAYEIHEHRAKLIRENVARLGTHIVHVRIGDALQIPETRLFDRILVDAPCSGLGTLGRRVDIQWAKSSKELPELCLLQHGLLAKAGRLLKPGGTLVYSTCTVTREENEKVALDFLKNNPNFSKVTPQITSKRSLITEDGFLRSWPHRHGIGGSFVAVLKKK